jgi:hypothetical protein
LLWWDCAPAQVWRRLARIPPRCKASLIDQLDPGEVVSFKLVWHRRE